MRRSSEVTECKKFVALAGNTKADVANCVRGLMYWCFQAQTFARKRDHMAFNPEPANCPPWPFMLARVLQKPDAPAAASVRTDADLDSAGVPLNLCPPESGALR